jgi:hypothetical protein
MIDDEALRSIESAPQPMGPTPPEDVHLYDPASQYHEAFVLLVSEDYTMKKELVVLAAQGRGGRGHRTEWNG